MSHERDTLAVRISAIPDGRLFGAGCFESSSCETLAELSRVMLDNIMCMCIYKFSMQYFPNNHVSLVVGNSYRFEKGWEFYTPGTEESITEGRYGQLFTETISEYNWSTSGDLTHPVNGRFILCGVRFLGTEESETMTGVGDVVKMRTACDCQFRAAL